MLPEFRERIDEQRISDVSPIFVLRAIVPTRQNLQRILEDPWLRAGTILYERGVLTLEATANCLDLESGSHYGWLAIDFVSLSYRNQGIARDLIQKTEHATPGEPVVVLLEDRPGYYAQWVTKVLQVRIPIAGNPSVRDFEEVACSIAEQFQPQFAIWRGMRESSQLP